MRVVKTIKCPECKRDIPENAAICPACGFSIKLPEDEYEDNEEKVLYTCEACGGKISSKARLCVHCGHPESLSVSIIIDRIIMYLWTFYCLKNVFDSKAETDLGRGLEFLIWIPIWAFGLVGLAVLTWIGKQR